MPLRQVGKKLGVSEEAAKKRVSRAVEKLREFLDRRGVKLSGVALGAVLAEKTVQTASAALADAVVKIPWQRHPPRLQRCCPNWRARLSAPGIGPN